MVVPEIGYNIIVEVLSANTKVSGQMAASVEFINCGHDYVNIVGVRIPPGGSWQPTQALPYEADGSQYLVRFTDTDTDPYLCVVRKFYVNSKSS